MYKVIETDEANDIAKIGMYSANSLENSDVNLDDYSLMNDSYDKNKEIKFKISDIVQIQDICRNIDLLVDNLINIAIPGVESIQFSSAH